jgi:hypothetical protein
VKRRFAILGSCYNGVLCMGMNKRKNEDRA